MENIYGNEKLKNKGIISKYTKVDTLQSQGTTMADDLHTTDWCDHRCLLSLALGVWCFAN